MRATRTGADLAYGGVRDDVDAVGLHLGHQGGGQHDVEAAKHALLADHN